MDQNKVALVYYQPIPKLMENVNGHSYYFNPQHSVSLCMVEPEDVDLLLSLKGGCCGGKTPIFHVANAVQIKVFETGHY